MCVEHRRRGHVRLSGTASASAAGLAPACAAMPSIQRHATPPRASRTTGAAPVRYHADVGTPFMQPAPTNSTHTAKRSADERVRYNSITAMP